MNTIKKFKDFTIITLNNGLKALIYPQSHVHSVSVIALVRAGHLCEEVEENGIAHLLEHILFDGTKKFPTYRKLTDFFDRIAGDFNGATTYESITIGGTFVDEELEGALFALDQLLFHPLLSEKFLQKQKGIILDELASYEDTNNYKHGIKTKKIRFKGKTILSLPLGGTSKSIENLSLEQPQNYHRKLFRPDNVNLVIAGKCDIKKAQTLLQKLFTYPPNQAKFKHISYSYKQFSNQTIEIMDRKAKKAYVRVTFPSFSWKHSSKDRITLAYLCSLFSNRRDSLLSAKLREKLGWIYDIDTDFLAGFDIGILEIQTSTPINKSIFVIEEILKAIQQVKNKQFSASKLEKIKEIDRKRMKMALDTTKSIVQWFAGEIFYRYPKILLPKDLIKIYNQITSKDIQKAAQDILDFEKINICVLQPFKGQEAGKYKLEVEKLVKKYC